MSTDEYVPSEARVRLDYQDCYPRLPAETTHAEFDRFLAKVKRDAAREALDGLMRHFASIPDDKARGYENDAEIDVEEYRDTHHPEETP